MAIVRVAHDIDDLANDLAAISLKVEKALPGVVSRNIREGNAIARGIARAEAGPHGKNYYKRLTAEMTGPLTGEYGPEGDVAGNAVGAGWRNGPPNTDLPKSLDIQGPKFAKDVGNVLDGLFW